MGKKQQFPDTQVHGTGEVDSCLGVGDTEALQSVSKRNNCPRIRIVGGRIYDSELGKTCHQCRQKTLDFSASCKNVRINGHCPIKYCHKCLLNRYGEKAEEVDLLNDWKCPKCQGICNCSVCMNKRGAKPTGNLVLQAKTSGFHSVSDMLNVKDNNVTKEIAAVTKETLPASPGNMGKENNIDGNSSLMKLVPSLNRRPDEKNSKRKKNRGSTEMHTENQDGESSLKKTMHKKSKDKMMNTKVNFEFTDETAAATKEVVLASPVNVKKENNIDENSNLMKPVPSLNHKLVEKKPKRMKKDHSTEMHTGNQDGKSSLKKTMHKKNEDEKMNTKDNTEFTRETAPVTKEVVLASLGNIRKENNIVQDLNLMKHVPSLNRKPFEKKTKGTGKDASTEMHTGNQDGKSSLEKPTHKKGRHETSKNNIFLVEHNISDNHLVENKVSDKTMKTDIHFGEQKGSDMIASFEVSSDNNLAKHSSCLEVTRGHDEGKNSSTFVHASQKEDMDISDDQPVLKKSLNHSNTKIDMQRNFLADIKLLQGMGISVVAEIELPPEYVGDALQFLEFCAAFREKLNIKEGLPKSILRELVHGRRSRRSQYSSAIQFQIQLLSLISHRSGEESLSFDSGSGRNSWLQALDECISESQCPFKELPSKCFKQGGYDKLDSLQKLKLLNFLCDETLETVDMRTWIEDQNKIFLTKKKQAREKVYLARDNAKCAKRKFQEEIAKAIIEKNGAPLSISEHDVIASQVKAAVEEAEAELSKVMNVGVIGSQEIYAVRTPPILLTDNFKVYWRLNSYTPKPHILLQELDVEETIITREKWSTFTMEQNAVIENFISFTRGKASYM